MSLRLPVDLVFDIGKTNKKLMLFDDQYEVVHESYTQLDEIEDDDGYPGENLGALTQWITDRLHATAADERFQIRGINISGYGASIVNLDARGELATPFYNYTKPLPDDFYDHFFTRFGEPAEFETAIASPLSGMLNSGFQLFYIQQYKPGLAQNIRYSLHFPQYLSFLITGKMVSDYTSLGCHTGLWDFGADNYHQWVRKCDLLQQLAPIVRTDQRYNAQIGQLQVQAGVGVHDSSAALLPYLTLSDEPFVLLSTGTWSVTLNPFNHDALTPHDLSLGSLCYMNQKGQPLKASRVFLGKEIEHQVEMLASHFHQDQALHRVLRFDPSQWKHIDNKSLQFNYQYIDPERFGYQNNRATDLSAFDTFEDAYLQLMDELTNIQVASFRSSLGEVPIKRVYIDGGFSSNDHFTQLLANKLSRFQVQSSSLAIGSSLGAAMLLRDDPGSVPVQCTMHEPTD